MVTQTEIARTTGLGVSTVNKILNQIPGFTFSQRTIKKVLETAEIDQAKGRGPLLRPPFLSRDPP